MSALRAGLSIVLMASLMSCAARRPPAYLCALSGAVAGVAVGAGVQAGRDESGGDIAAGAAAGAAAAALLGYVVCRFLGEGGEEEDAQMEPAATPPPPPPVVEAVRERIILRGLTFGFDEIEIDHADGVLLDEAARQLERFPDLAVRIEGHTDSTGPAVYNQYLSEQRAKSVKRYLEQAGVSPDRLATVGYGASQPLSSNDSARGRARNRRVELEVLEP